MTTITKHPRYGWSAEDVLPFAGDYQLTIRTGKTDGGIVCRASVSLHRDGFVSHAFGMGRGGDFGHRLLESRDRCTEKNVAKLHAEAMQQLQTVVDAAKAHYAKYPIPEHRR